MSTVSGSPTQVKTSCATLTKMTRTPDDAFLDNKITYVASIHRYFQIVRSDPTLVADGSTVLSTFSGNGYWVALEIQTLAWSYQSAWYIDPTLGNDENDGSTSTTAIKTWSEFQRRVSLVAVDMTITILGALTEVIEGLFQGYNGVWTMIIQGSPTTLVTLTGTTFTDPVRSGAQALGNMSSPDLASFTPYNGKMLRAGAQFVPILGVSGGGVPLLSYWTDESFTTTKPANGTVTEILQLVDVSSIRMSVVGLKLQIKYLRFTTADTFSGPDITGATFLRYVCCDFACTFFISVDTYLFSCLLSGTGSSIFEQTARFIGGGSKRPIFHLNAGCPSFTGFIIYAPNGVGLEIGNSSNSSKISQAETTGTSLGLGVFNAIGPGVRVSQGGRLSAQSLFGQGNSTYGFETNYGGQTWCATAPTITGTSGDLSFCAAATAIPPLTAGAVVPVASALTTWAQWAAAPFGSKVMNYGNGTLLAGA
jgi:hypothetical protein